MPVIWMIDIDRQPEVSFVTKSKFVQKATFQLVRKYLQTVFVRPMWQVRPTRKKHAPDCVPGISLLYDVLAVTAASHYNSMSCKWAPLWWSLSFHDLYCRLLNERPKASVDTASTQWRYRQVKRNVQSNHDGTASTGQRRARGHDYFSNYTR